MKNASPSKIVSAKPVRNKVSAATKNAAVAQSYRFAYVRQCGVACAPHKKPS